MLTLVVLALALSADAFAVALCQGAGSGRADPARALTVGAAFGAAQAGMPLLGWALSLVFAGVMKSVDHWIAFALLAAIGAKMIHEALQEDGGDCADKPVLIGWPLLAAAVATSIDAAAAGVTLELLASPVLVSCAVIGVTTLVLCAGAVLAGARVRAVVGRRAELAGGAILILLGAKILVEHLFFGG
jgi:manganese efflux pump family protein